MSIIRTRSGTLEFRQTPHGTVVVVNDKHLLSIGDVLYELLDAYYHLGLQHPQGSAGWLQELTGLVMDQFCPLCEQPTNEGDIVRCPACSIGRCPRCARSHDGSPICQLTREYASLHRAIRGGDDFDPSDFYFARRSIASSYIARKRH